VTPFFFWPFGATVPAVILIGFVFLMVRWLRGPRPDKALTILRERYARGELSKDEFERMRRDLSG
jgi:putative membrane protein